MGNLYRLNSLFEIEIKQFPGPIDFDKSMLVRSNIFDYLFLALSSSEDYSLLGEKPSEELLDYWQKNKLETGKPIQIEEPYYDHELFLSKNLLKKNVLVEWGNTSSVNKDGSGIKRKGKTILLSRELNSKYTQLLWKEKLKLNRLNSVICTSALEVDYAVSTMKFPIVLKTEFGFSGRGNFIIKDKKELKENLYRIKVAIRENANRIIVEEWVGDKRMHDFSGLFDINKRSVEFVALTHMFIDQFGSYKGTVIRKEEDRKVREEVYNELAQYLGFFGKYNGPISMDGFTFKKDGLIETQYMSEINFRWSMGRILFELDKKIGKSENDRALVFVSIKAKELKFKTVLSELNKLIKENKNQILLLTPIQNENGKLNPFACFYLSGEYKKLINSQEQLKKLLA